MNDYDYDFNEADEQQDEFGLIPDKTFAKIIMIIRSDKEDALTKSKSSEARMLDCEFTVISGKFKNRKFWQNMVVSGGKQDSKGNSISGNITRSTLRAILESSRNIKPDDADKKAVSARQVSSFWEFNEMEFVGKIRIKKAKKDSGYDDKNELAVIITPDKPEYQMIMSGKEIPTKPITTTSKKQGKAKEQAPAWGQETSGDNKEESSSQGSVPAWAK